MRTDPGPPGNQPRGLCDVCGLRHPKCRAHTKAGKPCGRNPKGNRPVCQVHGGNAPQVIEATARRDLEDRALRELRRWEDHGDVPVTAPLLELAKVAGETVAFKDYLRDQVTELNGVLAYWQEKDYLDSDGGVEWTKAAEDMRAVVSAYERGLDRCSRILANMVKLDLEGRLIALRETQAMAIVAAVREGLGTVDLAGEVRAAAEDAIADAIERLGQVDPAPLALGG